MKNSLFIAFAAISALTIFAVLPLGFHFAEDEFYPFVAIIMFFVAFFIVLLGYPVAFSLAGTGVLFALVGSVFDVFDLSILAAFPQRVMGVIGNGPLMAIPLFIFMGVVLERSDISTELLESMGTLFGKVRGGLGISVCVVGALLAASTGIVGATVVTMGLISLPTMLRYRYNPILASGIITASGTLGQIIPPSIVLIVLSDVVNSAYQQAQLNAGNFSPRSISVGDLFVGALVPGLVLVSLYILYVVLVAIFFPKSAPPVEESEKLDKSLNCQVTEGAGSFLAFNCWSFRVNFTWDCNSDRSRIGWLCGGIVACLFKEKADIRNDSKCSQINTQCELHGVHHHFG